MTINELIDKASLTPLALPCPDREVKGAYIGDLLSWVMGRASQDNAWITIMSNVNVIAVASLSDVSCVILAEGVTPDEQVITTACSKGINILRSDFDAFSVAKTLLSLGL